MENWNLSDWGLLATIVAAIIAAVALIVSKDFREVSNKLLQYRFIRATVLIACAFIGGWIVGTLKPGQPPTLIRNLAKTWPPQDGILMDVRERGYLRCGVHGGLYSFSKISGQADTTGFYENAEGFDADFCRVVATAIFGDYQGRVKFRPVDITTRFPAIENGTIDVLFRNTSATTGRELGRAIEFGPTIFYDQQSFMVLKDSPFQKLQDLNGQRICVVPDTTTLDNLKVEFSKHKFSFIQVSEFAGKKLSVNVELIGLLSQKQCEAVTSDKSQLIALASESGPSGNYRILTEGISKELLSPVTVKGDAKWKRIVQYSILATIEAAEMGITRANVNSFTSATAHLNIKAFLGLDDPHTQQTIGSMLGIRHDFTKKIITFIGNYDDIYEKHLASLLPERGWNQIWKHGHSANSSSCGMLISLPFTAPLPKL